MEIGSRIPKPRISDSTVTICWIPDSGSKSGPGINANQASQKIRSQVRREASKENLSTRMSTGVISISTNKRQVGARASNSDDSGVGTKEYITEIHCKIRLWWEKQSFVTSASDPLGYACLVPIYTYNVITLEYISKRTRN